MSDDNQNKSHWSSIFNWGIFGKFLSVGMILVVIYVIMIVFSPLMKLGKDVAHAWDAAWNVITKAFEGLCEKKGACLPPPGTPSPGEPQNGICNAGNPDTKGNSCSPIIDPTKTDDDDDDDDDAKNPCGSKTNGWCVFIPIGIALMFIVGGPFALLGLIGKGLKNAFYKVKEGGEKLCDSVSALTGRDISKILREGTDSIEEWKEVDEAKTKEVLEDRYKSIDGKGKKFEHDVIKKLIKEPDEGWPDEGDTQEWAKLNFDAKDTYQNIHDTLLKVTREKRLKGTILDKNKDLKGLMRPSTKD